MKFCWRTASLLLSLLFAPSHALQKEEGRDDDPGLSNFVSRPDIRAPKWNMKVYHEDLLAPGYWFVAPYRILKQETFGHGWVGAHIYDGKGELVWSGASMFSKGNVEDFRISNVRGEMLMTLMDQGRGEGIIFDNHYEIREVIKMDHFNSHEFNFVENGTRVLVVKGDGRKATREMSKAVGFNGECNVAFDNFEELDAENNWNPVFKWSSYGRVGLEESTLIEHSIQDRCQNGRWDYLHANSIDKTPAGDYLYSGRHTDTIYKISKDTGDIIWRLGGTKSDFEINDEVRFTRQHDVRFRGQNDTHLLFSILDNAKGIDHAFPPSHEFSRGLLIAINEKEMTASLEAHYNHPDGPGGYSPRRGNYQVLPNGNIFMGWSEQGVQSEHLPDGTLLMEAILAVDWLGTYRQYKFPYVGEPIDPPDVHAEAIGSSKYTTTTITHVSWNGATEVASWNLYKTTETGEKQILLASAERLGFETVLAHIGFAKYVVVKALDSDGKVLGASEVFETIQHQNITSDALDAENKWLEDVKNGVKGGDSGVGSAVPTPSEFSNKVNSVAHNPLVTFFFGVFCSAVVLLLVLFLRRRGAFNFVLRGTRYHRLKQAKEDPTFDTYSDGSDEQGWPLRSSSRNKNSDDDER